MGLNEFAAFDPIFYLHHKYVFTRFRCISLDLRDSQQKYRPFVRNFQALNEGTEGAWWTSQPLLERASYVTAIGAKETPTSHLIPFRREIQQNGRINWWTSEDLRYCRSLGYTYPELANSKSDPRALRQWGHRHVRVDHYLWKSTTIRESLQCRRSRERGGIP